MAKIIALEFTDVQWELLQEHYVVYTEQVPVDFTEAGFITAVQKEIGMVVTNIMHDKENRERQNVFEV